MSFRVGNDILIDASDVSTTDVVSESIDVSNIYGLSVQAISTGTLSGTVEIEVSNDGENFFALGSPTVTISNATNAGAQLTDMFYKFVRLRYSATSGSTNTLKVFITTKGI